jgi:glucose/arabinose dehydrogenase
VSARRLVALLAPALLLAVAAPAHGQAGVSYSIPPSNPFAGRAGAAPEVFAYGLRNPYRFSFDRQTGDLVIGDVGGSAHEEVDWVSPATARGANFGWPCREGEEAGPRSDKCPAPGAIEPLFQYPTNGSAVIAGYVVRDPSLTGLVGRILYADYYVGEIRSLARNASNPDDSPTGVNLGSGLSSFGQAPDGTLYVTHQGDGRVYRLVAGASPGTLSTQAVNGSFSQPTHVAFAPGDPSRLFVVEQGGRIRVVVNGAAVARPFLDITDLVLDGGERGLLSMAFAPDYASSGRFYVYYTDTGGNIQIDEFRRSADPSVADRNSRRHVISIGHPAESNHNGGQLQFGPDGYLYAGTGDGGGQNDAHDNAQDLSRLLGKLIRIDPAAAGAAPIRDVTPPLVRAHVPRRQRVLRLHGVVGLARCDEHCTLTMSGRVRIGRRTFELRPVTKAAAARTRVKMKARLGRRATRAIRRALKRHHKVGIVVGLRGRDANGNRSRLARTRVKPRR